MPYTTASGIAIPTGTDAFSPTAQMKTWADKAATYENRVVVALEADRTALATPVLRDGLMCYVTGTDKTWLYEGTTWRVIIEDTGWLTPTLNNNWVNFGGGLADAAYRRINGVVYLRGTLKDGSTGSGNAVLTLPAGARPASTLRFMLLSNTSIAVAYMNPSGQLLFSGTAPSNASLAIDNIRFVAEA